MIQADGFGVQPVSGRKDNMRTHSLSCPLLRGSAKLAEVEQAELLASAKDLTIRAPVAVPPSSHMFSPVVDSHRNSYNPPTSTHKRPHSLAAPTASGDDADSRKRMRLDFEEQCCRAWISAGFSFRSLENVEVSRLLVPHPGAQGGLPRRKHVFGMFSRTLLCDLYPHRIQVPYFLDWLPRSSTILRSVSGTTAVPCPVMASRIVPSAIFRQRP